MRVQADPDGPIVAGVKTFFAYFALLSYLIPISLVVSLELVKVPSTKECARMNAT